jgi:hypothetical protein
MTAQQVSLSTSPIKGAAMRESVVDVDDFPADALLRADGNR